MNNLFNRVKNKIRGKKLMKEFTIIIHNAEKDEEGYWAECLELKGVYAQGKDIGQIKEDMAKGIVLMLEELQAQALEKDDKAELLTLEVQHA
jgi:predicted RNase H-like HicB family nuclease